jgi:hypothetical protein
MTQIGEKFQISKRVDTQLELLIKNLKTIFEGRKNRSKRLRETVLLIIEQLMDFYEKILLLSPAYKRGSYPKAELLKQSIISTFANLKSLKDSQPFFDLLEWVSTMLVFYIQTLEELDSIKKNYEIVLAITNQFASNSDHIVKNYWQELTGDEDDSWTLKGGEKLERQNEVFSEQLKNATI